MQFLHATVNFQVVGMHGGCCLAGRSSANFISHMTIWSIRSNGPRKLSCVHLNVSVRTITINFIYTFGVKFHFTKKAFGGCDLS